MSLLLVGMDVTIVNVALPAIQQDLRATLDREREVGHHQGEDDELERE